MSEPTQQIPRHELRAAARKTRMPGSCRRVLDALIDRRGDNPTAWPKVATLVEDTACSERAVQLALRALEAAGWLRRVESDRRATEYAITVGDDVGRLAPPKAAEALGVQQLAPQPATQCAPEESEPEVQRIAPQGATECGSGCNVLHPGVQRVAPEPFREPYKELFRESLKDAPVRDAPQPAPARGTPPTIADAPPPALRPAGPPATPKPPRGAKPNPDPLWERFSALAVEVGQVDRPINGNAKTHTSNQSRAKALALLVADDGEERVMAVWRFALTHPKAEWWRQHHEGAALAGTFVVAKNYGQLAEKYDASQPRRAPAQPARTPLALVLPLDDLTPIDKLLAVTRHLGRDVEDSTLRAACGTDAHHDDVMRAARWVGNTLSKPAYGAFLDGWDRAIRAGVALAPHWRRCYPGPLVLDDIQVAR